MTQYLLSVWHDDELRGRTSRARTQQRMIAQVGAFNAEMPGRRRLGVRRRPAPGSRRPRSSGRDDEVSMTDGPYAESKEQMGGFWIIEVRRPRHRARLGPPGAAACEGPGRGPPVPG